MPENTKRADKVAGLRMITFTAVVHEDEVEELKAEIMESYHASEYQMYNGLVTEAPLTPDQKAMTNWVDGALKFFYPPPEEERLGET